MFEILTYNLEILITVNLFGLMVIVFIKTVGRYIDHYFNNKDFLDYKFEMVDKYDDIKNKIMKELTYDTKFNEELIEENNKICGKKYNKMNSNLIKKIDELSNKLDLAKKIIVKMHENIIQKENIIIKYENEFNISDNLIEINKFNVHCKIIDDIKESKYFVDNVEKLVISNCDNQYIANRNNTKVYYESMYNELYKIINNANINKCDIKTLNNEILEITDKYSKLELELNNYIKWKKQISELLDCPDCDSNNDELTEIYDCINNIVHNNKHCNDKEKIQLTNILLKSSELVNEVIVNLCTSTNTDTNAALIDSLRKCVYNNSQINNMIIITDTCTDYTKLIDAIMIKMCTLIILLRDVSQYVSDTSNKLESIYILLKKIINKYINISKYENDSSIESDWTCTTIQYVCEQIQTIVEFVDNKCEENLKLKYANEDLKSNIICCKKKIKQCQDMIHDKEYYVKKITLFLEEYFSNHKNELKGDDLLNLHHINNSNNMIEYDNEKKEDTIDDEYSNSIYDIDNISICECSDTTSLFEPMITNKDTINKDTIIKDEE